MPQLHLPLFPDGVTHITNELAFEKRDGRITYFNGHMPVFSHAESDVATFRMITSQFCQSGYAKQGVRGDVDQREAIGEALSGEGHERILCSARDARAGGFDRRCGGADRGTSGRRRQQSREVEALGCGDLWRHRRSRLPSH